MCSMFDTYENIPQNYIPNNIKPNSNLSCAYPTTQLEPIKPILPYEEYNAQGELIGYFWHYGDTLNLEFDVDGEVSLLDDGTYISASEFLQGKKATIVILDFRNDIVVERVLEASDKIIFEIDEELSKKIVRGTYHCTLTIWDDADFNKTIFANEDATFIVK